MRTGLGIGVARTIKWLELLFLIRFCDNADYLLNFIHFEINRPCSLRHNMKFCEAIRNENRIKPFRKEIDDGRAKESQTVRVDPVVEFRFCRSKCHNDFEQIRIAFFDRMRKIGQFEKEKPLGTGEIFLEQTITLETSRAVRKNRFVLTKTNSMNACGRKRIAKKAFSLR